MPNRAQALRAALQNVTGRICLLGHDNPDMDSLLSCVLMQRLLAFWGMPAQIVLPTQADEQCRQLMPKLGFDLEAWRGQTHADDALILVDHHAPQHEGTLATVIDHHPTDFPPDAPFVWLAHSGACAAMVYRLMQEAGMPVTREDEAMAVSALYLDTLALRSTKIRPEEVLWARERAAALGLDIPFLEREGLGLQDPALPADVLAMTGKKRFVFGKKVVFSSYVQFEGMPPELMDALLLTLKAALAANGADLWAFLYQNPIAMNSVEYDIWPDGAVDVIDHGRLLSRGKDVMPRIERRMRENDGCKA